MRLLAEFLPGPLVKVPHWGTSASDHCLFYCVEGKRGKNRHRGNFCSFLISLEFRLPFAETAFPIPPWISAEWLLSSLSPKHIKPVRWELRRQRGRGWKTEERIRFTMVMHQSGITLEIKERMVRFNKGCRWLFDGSLSSWAKLAKTSQRSHLTWISFVFNIPTWALSLLSLK